MSRSPSIILSVSDLLELINRGEPLAFLDVRYSPQDAEHGRNAYARGHLPGAVFVDFKAVLTAPSREHGGRSPLPEPQELARSFGRLGIDRGTRVVVYEDGNGPAASRLWWALRYLGHDRAHVLDGGYSAWTVAGLPVTDAPGAPEPRVFEAVPRPELLADVEEIRAGLGRADRALIDSRDRAQYLGEAAPFDPVAGRIPGALHHFWKDALDEAGFWRKPDELRRLFADAGVAGDIIVYCGSGISATPNVLALAAAGFPEAKLYAGSWSDWISYRENPVATGEE